MTFLAAPLVWTKDLITGFIKRRRHFTYEEWRGLIILTEKKKGKMIEATGMKVVFEYEEQKNKKEII